MRQISTKLLIFLVLLIGFSSTTYAASPAWPLKGSVDFSSGFGDFRPGRFHAGLDLRTGGTIGQPVYAPVNGFVSRVKMSYYGYGKGLYFAGADGRIYVFGHLSRFFPDLDRRVTGIQSARQRYFVEVEFPKDSIAVRAGDLLGFSGQTGAGAPHLHFEARTGDNRPLNPFTHGYAAKDNVRPAFDRIGFQLTDERSLLPNGKRQVFLPVRGNKKGNAYSLDTVLCFNRPFGLLVDCYDRIRPDGMKQAVYHLTVSIDNIPQYDVLMDTLEFESGSSADLVYDFAQATGGRTGVRRVFDLPGNDFPGIRKINVARGVIGLGPDFPIGRHLAHISAEDAAGNRSELNFAFLWGPPDKVFNLDSTIKQNDSTTMFYFAPVTGYEKLGIDSVVVCLDRGPNWGITPSAHIKRTGGGRLEVRVDGYLVADALMKLVAWTKEKGEIEDPPFSGWMEGAPKRGELHYSLDDAGLFVTAELPTNRAPRGVLNLYYRDSLLGTETGERYFTVQFFRWFVPPLPKYARIDRMEFVSTNDSVYKVLGTLDSLTITRVSPDEETTVQADSLFTVVFPRGAVNEPRFVSLKRNRIVNKIPLRLNSEHYQLLPETFAVRSPFGLRLRPFNGPPDSSHTALYRLDTLKNRWTWITDSSDSKELLHGTSRSGGSFAAVYDLIPPVITQVSVKDQEVLEQTRPVFSFKAIDSCSGFGDDRNFAVKVDGKWQIPEFDPETGICQTQPIEPLAPGSHLLSIEVRDRAGNDSQTYVRFEIRAAAPRKGK